MDSIIINDEKEAILKQYYSKIFPYKTLFDIFSINSFRELSFGKDDTTFIRYETFNTCNEFKDKILSLNPHRIDIGAVYDNKPSKTGNNNAIRKELVFDMDLTDYDRNCCKEKTMCEQCYELIKCGIEILDYIFKEEFGFLNYGFVFSGRRGIHCWVFNENDLTEQVRMDIIKYLDIKKNKYLPTPYLKILQKYYKPGYLKTNEIINWFPILDKQVTIKLTHLIKIPFSIHPNTMKVSIPLDSQNIKSFTSLPTVYDFLNGTENINNYINIMETWK